MHRSNCIQGREECKYVRADTKVSAEERGGGAAGAGAEVPMVRQDVPLEPMEDLTPEQVDAHRRLCCRAGSCQDLWPHGERKPTLGQACW